MQKNFFHIIQILYTRLKQLLAEKLQLEDEVSRLESELTLLQSRINNLEGQKNKTSRNSSKPPSSDKGRKKRKKVKNSRTKSGKKTGAQPANDGKTLLQVAAPDHTVLHEVAYCECGADLQEKEIEKVEKRQVFDLPELKLEVTEHQVEVKMCDVCGKLVKGKFPSEVTGIVQYGTKIKGAILDLSTQHFLSYERIQIFFGDWFGKRISGHLVNTSLQQGHHILNGAYRQKIVSVLLKQKILHSDETGLYFGGSRKWLHVISTSKLTLYHPYESRGRLAIEDMGVLSHYKGRIIHDNYTSYPTYKNCKHGLCNAHHLRELLFFEEEQQATWAYQLGVFLCSSKNHVDWCKQQGQTCLNPQDLTAYQLRYNEILQLGYESLPPDPPAKSKKGRRPKHPQHNFLNRFMDKKEEVLAFIYDFDVPFDNNQAERDLRMVKAKQKISGCFRTIKGAQAFASIRGYISTAKKNGIAVLEALEKLMKSEPVMPF